MAALPRYMPTETKLMIVWSLVSQLMGAPALRTITLRHSTASLMTPQSLKKGRIDGACRFSLWLSAAKWQTEKQRLNDSNEACAEILERGKQIEMRSIVLASKLLRASTTRRLLHCILALQLLSKLRTNCRATHMSSFEWSYIRNKTRSPYWVQCIGCEPDAEMLCVLLFHPPAALTSCSDFPAFQMSLYHDDEKYNMRLREYRPAIRTGYQQHCRDIIDQAELENGIRAYRSCAEVLRVMANLSRADSMVHTDFMQRIVWSFWGSPRWTWQSVNCLVDFDI